MARPMRALPLVLLVPTTAGSRVASRAFAEGHDAVLAALVTAAAGLKRVEIVEERPQEGRVAIRSRPLLFGSPATAWAHVFEIETGETQLDVGGDAALAERLLAATAEALSAARRA